MTGVGWSVIPQVGADSASNLAELVSICWRATSVIDTYVNQTLRATVSNEARTGPGSPWVGWVPDTFESRLRMSYWPVTEVLAIQISASSSYPRQWTTVPIDQTEVEFPLMSLYTDTASATVPDGGSTITLAPGNISRLARRNSVRVLTSYTNGWPHTSLTASVSADGMTLEVDDVTGWTGACGFIYDGGATEQIGVSAVSATRPLALPNGVGTAQAGPGTLTLSSPLANAHDTGVLVSALPANVMQAGILICAEQGVTAGINAVVLPALPGSESSSGGSVTDLRKMYTGFLEPFCRRV